MSSGEFADISGWDVEIYLMNPKSIDHVYGESNVKGYDGPFRTKLLYAPEVEKTLIDTFGFSNNETIQYSEMPKAIWVRDVVEIQDMRQEITYDIDYEQPKPGDLIKTLWDGSVYEITHVSSAERIFNGTKLVWSFAMKPYSYDYEGSEAQDVIFDELEINDFPDVNASRDKITEEQMNMERKIVKDEAAENDNFDSEIDPSVYGYTVTRTRD